MAESTTTPSLHSRPPLANRSNETAACPRGASLRSNDTINPHPPSLRSHPSINIFPLSLHSHENIPPTHTNDPPHTVPAPTKPLTRTLSNPMGDLNPGMSRIQTEDLSPPEPIGTISEGTDDNADAAAQLDTLLEELEEEDGREEEVGEEVEEGMGMGKEVVVREELLRTSREVGLKESEVVRRRKMFGWNKLREEREGKVKQFLMFFVGPIQFVMEAACLLAAGLRDWVDLGVIVGLLLLNACVGFAQDYSAGNIVKELKKGLALKSAVIREGAPRIVNSHELVPGDIVLLGEGVIVPADGHIVTPNAYMQVDQSAMTGESLAADKHTGDHVYQSSTIKRGEAVMIVTAIGDNTFVGRSAALVNAASSGKGHFTKVLSGIGTALLALVVLTLIVVWIASFYRSKGIISILTYTLAITIIGVPVGLPAVVTTTMAVGAMFLAKKQAIVQKLSAIESLAGVEILCTDKTGTLTKNKLSLGDPYCVQGIDAHELMLVACLAAGRKKQGLDAIDKAFLKALRRYPIANDRLPAFKVVQFTPFDPVSKKVTAVVESPRGGRLVCVKGAPPSIIKMVLETGDITDEVQRDYNEMVAEFARRGFRSLGVACKHAESPWVLLGIMPCSDPPRRDTAKTIKEAMDLGLKIKMLTGDSIGIAKETSRQLGLGGNVYNSEKLGLGESGDMPGAEVCDFVEAADGFAEVFPQHKYNVVDILQKRGYLVAMTGDGVNDAPSLKRADTGIAVEGSSDAARSAADIVFLAPGLSAIIDAIKTSRQIFHRMYAYVVYRIALSLHLELFLGLWIVLLDETLNIQLVVFIAIFADIATLAIAYDRAPFSRTPVKWNLPVLWGTALPLGIILAIGSWVCLAMLLIHPSSGIIQSRGPRDSVLFLEIALTQTWLILITRAGGRPFWSSRASWQLYSAVLLVSLLATVFCLFGIFDEKFGKSATDPVTVVRVWVFSFGVFCIMAGVHYLLADSPWFDRLMHLRNPFGGRKEKKRTWEDLIFALRRTSSAHDRAV